MPTAREPKKRSSGRPRWFSHRGLVAVEALLVCGLAKDLFTSAVKSSGLAPYGKVLFVMALTVGLFGGLFLFVERFTARTMAGGHRLVRGLPVALPFWVAHAAVLLALYFAYANHLGIQVL
ncbi:MAG: hypothetical protein ACKVXR_14225 [Planctomycetota bacterium]